MAGSVYSCLFTPPTRRPAFSSFPAVFIVVTTIVPDTAKGIPIYFGGCPSLGRKRGRPCVVLSKTLFRNQRACCTPTSDRVRQANDGRTLRKPGVRARADEAKALATKGCRCNGICKKDACDRVEEETGERKQRTKGTCICGIYLLVSKFAWCAGRSIQISPVADDTCNRQGRPVEQTGSGPVEGGYFQFNLFKKKMIIAALSNTRHRQTACLCHEDGRLVEGRLQVGNHRQVGDGQIQESFWVMLPRFDRDVGLRLHNIIRTIGWCGHRKHVVFQTATSRKSVSAQDGFARSRFLVIMT